jgi:hypothetical protein
LPGRRGGPIRGNIFNMGGTKKKRRSKKRATRRKIK